MNEYIGKWVIYTGASASWSHLFGLKGVVEQVTAHNQLKVRVQGGYWFYGQFEEFMWLNEGEFQVLEPADLHEPGQVQEHPHQHGHAHQDAQDRPD